VSPAAFALRMAVSVASAAEGLIAGVISET